MRVFLDQFGVNEMPWVVRAYLVLLVLVVLVTLAPGFAVIELPDAAARRVTDVGLDGIKLLLGAVLGSLSLAAQRYHEAAQGEDADGEAGPEA